MNPANVLFHTRAVGDCLEWSRGRTTGGYGKVNVGGYRYDLAHRVSYEQKHGPIPPGMVVRHTCDNPPCINPAHLLLGTQVDNARDAVERGQIRTGERAPASKHPDWLVEDARRMRSEGLTYRQVSDLIGVPFTTVREWLQGRVRHPENTRGPKAAGARR